MKIHDSIEHFFVSNFLQMLKLCDYFWFEM